MPEQFLDHLRPGASIEEQAAVTAAQVMKYCRRGDRCCLAGASHVPARMDPLPRLTRILLKHHLIAGLPGCTLVEELNASTDRSAPRIRRSGATSGTGCH